MSNCLQLHDYIRFRKEKRKVLLTDCSSMENYFFPFWTFKYLVKLKNGAELEPQTKRISLLIEDLKAINAISDGSINMLGGKSIFEKFERF